MYHFFTHILKQVTSRCFLFSLCHNEKHGQEGASSRVCQRPAQGHVGHTPNGRDRPAVHSGCKGQGCGETSGHPGYVLVSGCSDKDCILCVLMGSSSTTHSVQCRCGFDGAAGGSVLGLDEADYGGQPPWNHPDHPGFPSGHEGSGQGPHSGHGQHRRASR